MRLLLDTHAFLWFVLDDGRLGRNAGSLLRDPDNDLLVSPATFWEIAIKISIGKYSLGEDFASFMERQITDNDMSVLPITIRHTATVAALPFHHRDPFDRLLIAQGIVEHVPLLSTDAAFDKYSVRRVW